MANPCKPTIAVAICTYNRNAALTTLLESLLRSSAFLGQRGAVGVVVVDDSADGKAHSVVERFTGRFELGIEYRFSGRQNISVARNLAIGTASDRPDWIAMIHDDCEPVLGWQRHITANSAENRRGRGSWNNGASVPPGSPKWLTDKPFLELGLARLNEGAELSAVSTSNSMISSSWLKNHRKFAFSRHLKQLVVRT